MAIHEESSGSSNHPIQELDTSWVWTLLRGVPDGLVTTAQKTIPTSTMELLKLLGWELVSLGIPGSHLTFRSQNMRHPSTLTISPQLRIRLDAFMAGAMKMGKPSQ